MMIATNALIKSRSETNDSLANFCKYEIPMSSQY